MDAPIFISFASNDRTAADAICKAVERRGMNCWIATRNIGAGENFQEAITRAIRSAKVMILVFSAHANNSLEVKKEIALAGRYNVIVVPVRVEDVVPNDALSYELAVRQWIDMFEDWEQAIERLVTQVASVVGTEAISTATIAPAAVEPTLAAHGVPGRTAAAPAPAAERPQRRSPMAYIAATLGLVIVVGGALVWQLWPAHRSSTARTPHAQTAQTPPAAAVSSATPPSNAASPAPAQSAAAIPSPPPAVQPSQPQAAAVPLPAEPPRLEGVERALSALRERRAEREPLNTQNERAGEMNRMPPAEGLLPRDRFPVAAAMRAAREEHTGKIFRDCPHCPEMVVVPAGRFEMGAGAAEHERFAVPPRTAEHEQPQHAVTIAKPFALAKFEVTRGEFRAFVTATNYMAPKGCMVLVDGRPTPRQDLSWDNAGFEQTDRDPVVCVNLSEIDAYLEWLQRQTGKPYRLPTEAEWEYATRGGTATAYYWGDNPDQVCEYENIGDLTAKERLGDREFVTMACRDGFVRTAPVGSFKPNPFGLHDMLGNVHEFTADCWAPSYSGAPSDGSAQSNPGCTMRTIRKAAYSSGLPMSFRSAHRYGEPAEVRRNRVGFRVALTLR